MIDFKALSAPFNPDEIEWRVGSTTKDKAKGMALAYLNARTVMDRLDAVCGPMGWQCKYSHANGKTVCDIGLVIQGIDGAKEWIWKADGAGDSDIEAEKGALSDAFKRAAVRWGIGRYLYELPSPWVELDEWKRIKTPEYKKLDQILRQHTQRIINPPSNTERGATNALSSAKDDIARMNNEKVAPMGLSALKLGIDMAVDEDMLDTFLRENKGVLNALNDDEYEEAKAYGKSKREALRSKVAA